MTVHAAMVALVGATVPLGIGASASPAPSCRGAHPSASWQTLPAPSGMSAKVQAGGHLGTAFLAVDPIDARRLYAVTGTTVVRSTDGGCTWRQVFDLSTVPQQHPTSVYAAMPAFGYTIEEVVTPRGSSATDGRYVYILAMAGPGFFVPNAAPVLVGVSTDGGSSWTVQTPAQTTTMPVGAPACDNLDDGWLVPAPSRPTTAYFYCVGSSWYGVSPEGTVHRGDRNVLYRTTDGGASWAARSVGATGMADGQNGGPFGVDPRDANTLYGIQPGTIPGQLSTTTTQFVVSHDGGVSWTKGFQGVGWDPINVIFTMAGRPHGPASLASYGQAGLCVSRDGGVHGYCWKPPKYDGEPGLVSAATWSPHGDRMLVFVGYDKEFQTTRCAVHRLGVLDIATRRWHPRGAVPLLARGMPGTSVAYLSTTVDASRPTVVAQPCSRGGLSGWQLADSPVDLVGYTASWTR